MLVQPHSASPQVAGAIRQAATSTGASFNYLLTTAQIESNFNPAAQAATSTAKGLYQFIDQTWLGTMKAAGRALGLDRFAAAISRGEDGRFEVQDSSTRQAIMNLRGDPKVSAMLAGHYAQANAAQLKDAIGRAPTEGELYIAHFLGADGASRLIGAATNRPNTSGADLFPSAAAANRSIFYDKSGNARTAAGVYRELTGRYETARASAGADVAATPLRGSLPADTAVARVPDTAGVAQAYAAAQPVAFASVPKPPAAFQSIFSDTGRQGVGPVVRTLWSTPADGAQSPRPRSLFGD
jgi:muramidase (phage lysozyme)